MTVPIPANEAARLAALHSFQILDTLPESSYDDITLLASQICGTPIAAMTLIYSERQWFKSKVGTDLTGSSRELAFCAHTILGDDLMVVPNTLDDERFVNNPLVLGDPKIRFYAGAPLITPTGEALGTVCVIDPVQRTLSDTQTNSLRALSRQVMAQLELRRLVDLQMQTQRKLEESQARLESANARLQTESITDDSTTPAFCTAFWTDGSKPRRTRARRFLWSSSIWTNSSRWWTPTAISWGQRCCAR